MLCIYSAEAADGQDAVDPLWTPIEIARAKAYQEMHLILVDNFPEATSTCTPAFSSIYALRTLDRCKLAKMAVGNDSACVPECVEYYETNGVECELQEEVLELSIGKEILDYLENGTAMSPVAQEFTTAWIRYRILINCPGGTLPPANFATDVKSAREFLKIANTTDCEDLLKTTTSFVKKWESGESQKYVDACIKSAVELPPPADPSSLGMLPVDLARATHYQQMHQVLVDTFPEQLASCTPNFTDLTAMRRSDRCRLARVAAGNDNACVPECAEYYEANGVECELQEEVLELSLGKEILNYLENGTAMSPAAQEFTTHMVNGYVLSNCPGVPVPPSNFATDIASARQYLGTFNTTECTSYEDIIQSLVDEWESGKGQKYVDTCIKATTDISPGQGEASSIGMVPALENAVDIKVSLALGALGVLLHVITFA